MEENKLFFPKKNSNNKFSESENKLEKQYNKIKEDNKYNDEKNYVFVIFKGKTLKIEKKPRNNKKLVTTLTENRLSISLNSKNNRENKDIIDREKQFTNSDRKKVVMKYKTLLKNINFSPSQKLHNVQNNLKSQKDKRKIIFEEKIKKNKEKKDLIYKKENLNKKIIKINENNNKKGIQLNQISLNEISNNIKEEDKNDYIKKTIEEYDEINIKIQNKNQNKKKENKKKSYSAYKTLSQERDKYKRLRLKNKIYEEEKNSLLLVNINQKLNKFLLEFNKENEKKTKEKNFNINSKSLYNYNIEGKNLLNRIRDLKKFSQK